MGLLIDNLESCSQKIDWVKGTKLGPNGEDLFAQMCMDWQGVAKVSNFEVTTDGACPNTRKRYGQKANGIFPVPRRHNGSGCLSKLARNRGHSEQQFAASCVPLRPLSPACISSAGRRLVTTRR